MSIADTLPNGFWPLQILGALTITQQRSHLLADHPGAGKTLQAMLAAELDGLLERRSNLLITAPKTACQLTWAPEIARRIASQYAVVVADLTGTLGTKKKTPPSMAERGAYLEARILEAEQLGLPLIVLVNFNGLFWPPNSGPKIPALWSIMYDFFAIDEAHLVLPTKADRITDYTQFWRGIAQIVTKPNAIRLPMTGTPDRGQLQNRYGHWKFMYPSTFRSYLAWESNHFGYWYDDEGRKHVIPVPRDEAAWVAFDRVAMTRRTKAEMLEGMPEKQWAGDGAVMLPMSEAMSEQLNAFSERLEETLAEGDGSKRAEFAARSAAYVRGRQLSICTWDQHENKPWRARRDGADASPVLAWIIEWLAARGHEIANFDASLGKVVITSYFTEVLAWLQDELETAGFGRIPILSGDTPLEEKLAIEREFQRGDLRILLFSGHLGVSINLDAADDMIFTDVVHDPDKIEQTEDRIHRASRIHQVTYWRLVVEGSVMEDVLATVDHRYNITRRTYDGSRGIPFARKLLGNMEGLAA